MSLVFRGEWLLLLNLRRTRAAPVSFPEAMAAPLPASCGASFFLLAPLRPCAAGSSPRLFLPGGRKASACLPNGVKQTPRSLAHLSVRARGSRVYPLVRSRPGVEAKELPETARLQRGEACRDEGWLWAACASAQGGPLAIAAGLRVCGVPPQRPNALTAVAPPSSSARGASLRAGAPSALLAVSCRGAFQQSSPARAFAARAFSAVASRQPSEAEAAQPSAAAKSERNANPAHGQRTGQSAPKEGSFPKRLSEEPAGPLREHARQEGPGDGSAPPPPRRSMPLLLASLMALSGVAIGLVVYDAILAENALLYGAWKFDWDAAWLQEAARREAQLAAQGIQTHPPAAVKAAEAGAHLRPPTRQIILVRHGQYANVASANDDEQGLTERGKAQAAITGRRLKELLKDQHVVAIWHSNMKRARETAEIIHKEAFEDTPLLQDPVLAEGVPAEPVPPSRTFKPSAEEVMVDSARIEQAFRRYFYRALPPPPPSNSAAGPSCPPSEAEKPSGPTPESSCGNDSYIILVCHGNVIRYMLMRALQLPGCAWLRWATYNAGISWISIDSKGYVSCREFGDVGHLQADMITYH
ncbi:phosphoglycerate mutase [Besnoitia besnoiti]|uniref:Serine/threonine-protein phosphatase PGAM5, mitochondrial n=1 Tax=Besnoitia besnoiti TaxID=94643 RepID=A0A2A9MA91_BESBE|nr:phosphoglycerate mutase [Besnoitia besnoiti]PFH35378.1 phosphoglycerate mutase [Besnoitia besnoiti]